tara:strand:+ start:165 stop:908 length:744 start_codon:yes stop_codon:yes gene_type:complete
MCGPLAVGIAMGGAQAISGIQEQNRAHRAQVDAVNRSNAMARQKYLNDIQISAYNDQQKLNVFDAQLGADAASQQAYYQQKEINQIEANRAVAAADQELQEKLTEQMFASQANLAKAIQAQGTVLASSMASGQSMMLELTQAERELGFEQAQIDATIFDATRSYGIDRYGIDLDQYSADTNARNSITTSALIAPTASFKTIRPIKQNAPSKPSILGPILGGATTAIGVASGIGGKDYIKTGLSSGTW